MRKAALALFLGASLFGGCVPHLFRYMHVVLHESPTLKVVKRSTESNDTQGKPLSGRRVGLPTKSVLTRPDYTIVISTQLNSGPSVFLKSEGRKQVVRLSGAHLREMGKLSVMGPEGHSYAFIVDEARGAPLEFDVISKDGSVVGHEKIGYDVVSRGYQWEVDSL